MRDDGFRRTAIAIGVLFWISNLVTVIGSAISGQIPTTAGGLGAVQLHTSQFTAGTLISHVNDAAIVGYAVLLFPVLSRYSPGLALSYTAFKVIEGVLLLAGAATLLSLATLKPGQLAPGSADLALTQVFWLGRLATFAYLVATPILNLVLLRTRVVPQALSLLGLAGCALLVTGLAIGVGDPTRGFQPGQLLVIPIILWELALATWLVVKGFSDAQAEPESKLRPGYHNLVGDFGDARI